MEDWQHLNFSSKIHKIAITNLFQRTQCSFLALFILQFIPEEIKRKFCYWTFEPAFEKEKIIGNVTNWNKTLMTMSIISSCSMCSLTKTNSLSPTVSLSLSKISYSHFLLKKYFALKNKQWAIYCNKMTKTVFKKFKLLTFTTLGDIERNSEEIALTDYKWIL